MSVLNVLACLNEACGFETSSDAAGMVAMVAHVESGDGSCRVASVWKKA